MTKALRLSTAFVLSLSLCGAALAAPVGPGTSEPGTSQQSQQGGTPPTDATNAGMSKAKMHQGAGTPTPGAPNKDLNNSAPNTTAGTPSTTTTPR
jgi:hypothetical protein